ncbi:UNKNOWN [Stylonychia lemnae]|uniref:MIP18 family-like domain-containing protein n=1 Tax=Stylonychia lemnae TaxID=5949 RepID=A0A077ZYB0_STYLE|nr:UNKNOWN [Stylonychia lemnae]|eukprot:CDW74896.1 UNKNOWN [Stylonychia lemnae]
MSSAASSLDGKNRNPIVQAARKTLKDNSFEKQRRKQELDDTIEDEIDSYEVFDMLRHINDPEHPLTLEQLNVVTPELISVDNRNDLVKVCFTPTIPNCTMATLIGLMIRVKLHRSLPSRFKVDVMIEKGKHDTEQEINKQLNDKERVLAALENANLSIKLKLRFNLLIQNFKMTSNFNFNPSAQSNHAKLNTHQIQINIAENSQANLNHYNQDKDQQFKKYDKTPTYAALDTQEISGKSTCIETNIKKNRHFQRIFESYKEEEEPININSTLEKTFDMDQSSESTQNQVFISPADFKLNHNKNSQNLTLQRQVKNDSQQFQRQDKVLLSSHQHGNKDLYDQFNSSKRTEHDSANSVISINLSSNDERRRIFQPNILIPKPFDLRQSSSSVQIIENISQLPVSQQNQSSFQYLKQNQDLLSHNLRLDQRNPQDNPRIQNQHQFQSKDISSEIQLLGQKRVMSSNHNQLFFNSMSQNLGQKRIFGVERSPQRVKCLEGINRKTGKKLTRNFPLYTDNEIFPDEKDQDKLMKGLIEMMQDDDVDTDDDILNAAYDNCMRDLIKAMRVAKDTSEKKRFKVNMGMCNNSMIQDRVKNPQMYDRNGVRKIIPHQNRSTQDQQLKEDIDQVIDQFNTKISCPTKPQRNRQTGSKLFQKKSSHYQNKQQVESSENDEDYFESDDESQSESDI